MGLSDSLSLYTLSAEYFVMELIIASLAIKIYLISALFECLNVIYSISPGWSN
jgi:hypothetical protein